MAKDGYWVAGEGYSLGYPMGAAGFGMYGGMISESGIQARAAFVGPSDYNGRPGYEVRVLMASANILARHGQQQPCEDMLTATRGLYKSYLSDMQKDGAPTADMPEWRQRQIAAALPVTGSTVAFRSDELLGAEVRSPDGVALGSVDDLAMNPETGKLGYLVIARGGFFGFDETVLRSPGMISRPRPTQVSWCWTRPRPCSTQRRRSARTRSQLAQAPIAIAGRWTTTGGQTYRPRRAPDATGAPTMHQASAPSRSLGLPVRSKPPNSSAAARRRSPSPARERTGFAK